MFKKYSTYSFLGLVLVAVSTVAFFNSMLVEIVYVSIAVLLLTVTLILAIIGLRKGESKIFSLTLILISVLPPIIITIGVLLGFAKGH